jgi:hypothetical protein
MNNISQLTIDKLKAHFTNKSLINGLVSFFTTRALAELPLALACGY